MEVLQIRRRQRQWLSFEATEVLFNQILLPISQHGLRQGESFGRGISRIDVPPQHPQGFLHGAFVDPHADAVFGL